MRIVSAIYLNCHTVLKDDWISKTNFDDDLEEGRVRMRTLFKRFSSDKNTKHICVRCKNTIYES